MSEALHVYSELLQQTTQCFSQAKLSQKYSPIEKLAKHCG